MSAKKLVQWIDEHVERATAHKDNKDKKRNPFTRFYETHEFGRPRDKDINIASLDIYWLRSVKARKHLFNLVIDPNLTIGDKLFYDKTGIKIDIENIPETLRIALKARIENRNGTQEPLYFADLVEAGNMPEFPRMKFTSITEDDDMWLEMEESWEPWKNMRQRILAKHGRK